MNSKTFSLFASAILCLALSSAAGDWVVQNGGFAKFYINSIVAEGSTDGSITTINLTTAIPDAELDRIGITPGTSPTYSSTTMNLAKSTVVINATTQKGKNMIAMVLTAIATGKPIGICIGNYMVWSSTQSRLWCTDLMLFN